MNISIAKNLYQLGCTIIIPLTTISALDSRPYLNYEEKKKIDRRKNLIHNIGYGTIGFFVGATYPISFPLAALYTIVDINQKNKKD